MLKQLMMLGLLLLILITPTIAEEEFDCVGVEMNNAVDALLNFNKNTEDALNNYNDKLIELEECNNKLKDIKKNCSDNGNIFGYIVVGIMIGIGIMWFKSNKKGVKSPASEFKGYDDDNMPIDFEKYEMKNVVSNKIKRKFNKLRNRNRGKV